MSLECIRNIGISAHIDSGKTTLTERILYYTGKIHKMGEVHDGDTVMDSDPIEMARGITINSAATYCNWLDHEINIIDTPGHVDFTIEVERSLRVLDGAIMVLCAVAGVQSQSITVDRQMKRYKVPRIAFINKMDRQGADIDKVLKGLTEELNLRPVLLQVPIGETFDGIIDLVSFKACYFSSDLDDQVIYKEVPEGLYEQALNARYKMLEELSLYSDTLMEILLEGKEVPTSLIVEILHINTINLSIVPVLIGSAYKNKGVQQVLDAVINYLPSPLDRVYKAYKNDVEIIVTPTDPLVAMVFKLTEDDFGQLSYLRIYSGHISKGMPVLVSRTGQRIRIGRIVRMHSTEKKEVLTAKAGDIVALMGVDCYSGDTLCDLSTPLTLERMYVPDPVISLAIVPETSKDIDIISKVLNRYMKEDPTFKVSVSKETGDTIISGMGELHLEVYIERIRKCGASLQVGSPTVSYKDTIRKRQAFNYLHKKQTGGNGQYGHVIGYVEPCDEDFIFENKVVGGSIPKEYIKSCEAGFRDSVVNSFRGYPIVGVRVVLTEGSTHSVDSSDIAYRVAAQEALKEAFASAGLVKLEPIMDVTIDTPKEFIGSVQGDISSRRGLITSTEITDENTTVKAKVPLAKMFGYSTSLRSATSGKASFSMEFLEYQKSPENL